MVVLMRGRRGARLYRRGMVAVKRGRQIPRTLTPALYTQSVDPIQSTAAMVATRCLLHLPTTLLSPKLVLAPNNSLGQRETRGSFIRRLSRLVVVQVAIRIFCICRLRSLVMGIRVVATMGIRAVQVLQVQVVGIVLE